MPKADRRKRFIPERFVAQVARAPFERYVYFARNESNGSIKIGTTYGPRIEDRMWELARDTGAIVTLLALVVGDHKVEHSYHRLLTADRISGEWFRSSEAVAAILDESGGRVMTPDAVAYWGEWATLL